MILIINDQYWIHFHSHYIHQWMISPNNPLYLLICQFHIQYHPILLLKSHVVNYYWTCVISHIHLSLLFHIIQCDIQVYSNMTITFLSVYLSQHFHLLWDSLHVHYFLPICKSQLIRNILSQVIQWYIQHINDRINAFTLLLFQFGLIPQHWIVSYLR